MVITYPVAENTYATPLPSSGANGLFYLLVAFALNVAALFVSYKPLTLTVLPFTPLSQEASGLDKDLVKRAYEAGVTEIEVRPWSWLDRTPTVQFTISGTTRDFEHINNLTARVPYQLVLKPDGQSTLTVAKKPTTVKEARMLQTYLHWHLGSVVDEVAKARQDEEYVRTGRLPKD